MRKGVKGCATGHRWHQHATATARALAYQAATFRHGGEKFIAQALYYAAGKLAVLVVSLSGIALHTGIVKAETSNEVPWLRAPSANVQAALSKRLTNERLAAVKALKIPMITYEDYLRIVNGSKTRADKASHALPVPLASRPSISSRQKEDTSTPLGQPQRVDISKRSYLGAIKMFSGLGTPTGKGYCSGQYIGSVGVIITAAHCVIDEDGRWKENFLIRQASPTSGGQPRTIQWQCMSVYRKYPRRGERDTLDRAYDYAFIKTLEPFKWSFDFQTGAIYGIYWSIGYPSNIDSGLYLMQVMGRRVDSSNRIVLMGDNPFGPGSSGGQWFNDLDQDTRTHGGTVAGITSFLLLNRPNVIGSPFFNLETARLFEYVESGKCSS